MLLRDRLLAKRAEQGDAPDDCRLVEDVLGIRGATPALARKLIAQALVIEDRRDTWARTGEQICEGAPAAPGIYVMRDGAGVALYVGKAVDLRRRLRTHFAARRWKALSPEMSRIAAAEWTVVGSELEALLCEAEAIAALRPVVNVQVGPPAVSPAVPRRFVRDVIVLLPSIDAECVEIVMARADGPHGRLRTRRDGSELSAHVKSILGFFRRRDDDVDREQIPELAPIVFSWLARRGEMASRLHPTDLPSGSRRAKSLREKLRALFRDERLFHERLEQC
jgi:predicted GIY-YIG superfamily endonuclease